MNLTGIPTEITDLSLWEFTDSSLTVGVVVWQSVRLLAMGPGFIHVVRTGFWEAILFREIPCFA